jgi:hypothetical protein
VRLSDAFHILEAELAWDGLSTPRLKSTPFAKVPWGTAAARVAELITLARSKRLSRYPGAPGVVVTNRN